MRALANEDLAFAGETYLLDSAWALECAAGMSLQKKANTDQILIDQIQKRM